MIREPPTGAKATLPVLFRLLTSSNSMSFFRRHGTRGVAVRDLGSVMPDAERRRCIVLCSRRFTHIAVPKHEVKRVRLSCRV
jgi:hypothetical protein